MTVESGSKAAAERGAPEAQRKLSEQKAFEHLSRAEVIGAKGQRFVGGLFRPFFSAFSNSSRHWSQDADQAIEANKTLRARSLLYGIVLTFTLLIVWAAFAPIDEVTRGEGKVIPSRQLQIVQSVDGGVIDALFVKEGDVVDKGDLLVRIDPTRFVANYEESNVRAFALEAKVARLKALIDRQPLELAFGEAVSPEQVQVLNQEQGYYQASLNELAERVAIAKEQVTQRQQELSEVQARIETAIQSYQMSTQELEATRPLLESGAVSQIEILRLQRDQTGAKGEQLQAEARARQVEASIEEAEARILEVEFTMRNKWRAELSEASSQLNSLKKNVAGLADRVKLSEIRSPVNGTVQRVLHNTLGGVVQPGNAVIEIVPSDDRLLVEAKIAPKDIAFLRPGLPATIKLHAYDFSVYGGIPATLQHISADTITDDRDNTFYLVRAITTGKDAAGNMSVIPGMTAQLDIMTGKRTILSYLLKPLLRAKANALSER
ncbi:HlyD family type I secretion periplasmic adaptor subunit [Marinobacter sp. AL4B]|uniref:HlyD family type I secretion periplasmic adaptor subunit n=1 Tax=Marinobacter sp. AL4B TaxID=2871173 RepID=UPI001CAA48A9|nr:HlyD family type I secretion periplasmic adaptor subunit [Marinobacter sp. AL4B]MBZ0334551.1 HlyD family type I secretion periplasmic adaptor subunit [Marinobacter sp. AL4B]